ncbi:DegT/DnrJ/EryC1/StrS family aminotransferase [Natronococcus sp. A-GB7]|uniref:DegT/DnrJ/EryC1/StrS family aminotransferase n=1 Tax=Natronococcus sp. A-GB7 TaxID=3037649 RepID=UPI00241E9BF3|nr:DegT/DnrJ/EryC1/StrS family aminotransferase [Natronococcus sp. A-GB7]MDG5819921.1 DegT/DnrJ/EryC1/StrS family aminotransferase [Natronococcus sp. A-GB7]
MDSTLLLSRALGRPDPNGVLSTLEQHEPGLTAYGSGKAALRDGLAPIAADGGNVLLPAYLPDGVAEPLFELGLEPRYYRIRPDLGPDLSDVDRRLDAETVAGLSVEYFGFPQPRFDEFGALLAEYGCQHVDDNAHASLSLHENTLLGTRGDLGITSLWKLLPIPDGAVLYCNSDAARAGFEPSSIAGVRDRIDGSDCRFVAKALAADVLESNARLRRSAEGLLASRGGRPPVASPGDRYEAGKRPMSRLSARVLERVDARAIRATRRENYRAWLRLLSDRDDLEIVRPALPEGICPQAVPVRTSEPDRLLAVLETAGIATAHTWPRLAEAVRTDPTYATATKLAAETVAIPVRDRPDRDAFDALAQSARVGDSPAVDRSPSSSP